MHLRTSRSTTASGSAHDLTDFRDVTACSGGALARGLEPR